MTRRADTQRELEMPTAWSHGLSTEQLRFYFLHEMNPQDPDVYICRTLRITGRLDNNVLRASVLDMAARHDILRSYYPDVDDQPQIWLRDEVEDAVIAIDLSRLSPDERERRADELVTDELRIRDPFRIEEGPLFRVTAIKLDHAEHVVIFRFHHIVVDGTSVRMFLHGLWETYSALSQERLLQRQPHQYRDFIQRESTRLEDDARKGDREYWGRTLARPTVLDLTIGTSRPSRHTREAGTVHAHASPHLLAALRAACKARHVSPYMVMLAVFQGLLHRLTGKHDVLVASPIAFRPRREFQQMLGVLLNWIAFRADVKPDTTFSELLARVRTDVPDAYVKQCSYENLLVAAGEIHRDPARNPLFQVTLNYATYGELPAPMGLAIDVDPVASTETHYDLSVRFEEVGDQLALALTYYKGAMDRGAAEKLAGALLALAEHSLAHPDARIADAQVPELLELIALTQASTARRVVIASTFTAESVQPIAEHWLDQIGLRSEIEFAPVNQVFQTLLDPAGSFAKNTLGINVLLVRCEDWKDTAFAVGELCTQLTAYAERCAVDTIVVVCPPSEANRSGRAAVDQDRFEREISRVADATSRVHFLSWKTIASLYPVDVIDDAESDSYAQAPYSEDFNVALGTALARTIHGVVRPPPKAILVDCDNTLWRGVVGEDGPDGIAIDDGHRRLQQFLADQLAAGVLVGLVSKNNEAEVWEAFETAPGMILRKDMIVAHRINWDLKSRNIESLAAELNLGIDACVFIDDSPAECAEVRGACPGVLVLQLPDVSTEIERFLAHLWPLDRRKVTDVDRKRTEMYVANARREQLRGATSNLRQFVASLGVTTTIAPLSAVATARASQLTQRTNQFNTTTLRRSEAEIHAELADGARALIVDVSDRFGDYGIVGLVTFRIGRDVLEVDSLLLSCRALGRGVEHEVVAELGRIAESEGLGFVEIALRRSAKNKPAFQFLQAIAAQHRIAADTEGHYRYQLPVADARSAADKLATAPSETGDVKDAVPSEVDGGTFHALWQRIPSELDTVAKIRAALSARYSRPRMAWSVFVAPRTELEQTIASVWSEVLLIDKVGATDDYFALGGDSLRSLAVVSKLRKAGLPIAVLDIHQHPMVAQLADVIAQRREAPAIEAARRLPAASGPYPLSFSQRFVVDAYASENLRPDREPTGAFHIQDRIAVRERNGHSIAALRRAAELLVRRTAILRTKIVRDGDSWNQIEIPVSPAFEIIELAHRERDQQQNQINKLLFEDRMRPFDPQSGAAMIRFYAIVTGAQDFELVITAHHGFCDGWSLQGFYNHLFALYEAYKQGDAALVDQLDRSLAAHESSFREIVHHEQQALASEPLVEFWRTYFPTRFHVSVLHATKPPGYKPRLIRHGTWRAIEVANERARTSRTSLKAVLLEAFSSTLARQLNTRSPLVVAVVTNGRKDDLVAPMEVFGLCWTFVPIVSKEGDRSARLLGIHRDLIATEAHARYPIEGMFRGFDPETVVRAAFNFTNFHNSGWRAGSADREITPEESFHRLHFPLNFNIRLIESSKTVVLKVTFAADVFDEQFVNQLLDEFLRELDGPMHLVNTE